MPKKQPNDPVRVTDLSHEVPAASADENNHSRTRVAGFHEELEQAHRKIAELERERESSATHTAHIVDHFRRRTWALGTAFVTLGAKAGYGMATSGWGDQQWWLNFGQAVGIVLTTGYVIAPNIRKLLRLASVLGDPERRGH
ncbi:hypothetical protein [Micromonospora sp. DT62]|uniref:hypothetical protein n=1 Tax=Micromonospora sp. DT62 TaxID=3416521 RepID=UPI003CEB2F3F